MAQHHLAAVHPRAGVGPELVAVRAVRIGEDVDRAGGVLLPVFDPVAGLELAPRARGHGTAHGFLQRCFGHLLTLRIQQRARDDVLAVGRHEQGERPLADVAGPGREAARRGEGADDGDALLLERLQGGRAFRRGDDDLGHDASDADGGGRGEGKDMGFQFHFLGPEGGRLASRSASEASESSPRRVSTSRPSASKKRVVGRAR